MNRLGTGFGRLATLACMSALSLLASAAQVSYEQSHFEAVLARGGAVVVALVADWCMTCSRQEAAVSELLEERRFENLTVIVADFDREVELRRRLRVVLQGTFVVFKDGNEVARATGASDKAAIGALFARAL